MKALESLQLVRIRPRIGAIVLSPSLVQLKKAENFSVSLLTQNGDVVLDFRKILEVGLASLAAERADRNDIRGMQALLDKYTQSLKAHQIDNCADISFHDALAAASKNPIAINAWKMTCARVQQLNDLEKSLPNVGAITLRDHEKIFKAIQEHNPAKARAAMRTHLTNVERVWRIVLAPEPNNSSTSQPQLK
jgi:GntR family transcriptional repressor for pyruvate dehydrogenase complex